MTLPGIEKYPGLFSQCVSKLDEHSLKQVSLEPAVGQYKDAVFLKLYKKEWANPSPDPLTAASRIFFSVWVTPQSLAKNTLWYNIHALKLRQLAGYRIGSRMFAETFRSRFIGNHHQWPNLRVDFGPLTLMEGWDHFDENSFLPKVKRLANHFLPVAAMIDETLALFKK